MLSALCSCPEGLLRICSGGTKDIPGVSGRSCSSWGKPELNRQRQSVGGFRTRERAVKLGTIGAPGDVSGHKPNSRVLGIPCIPMLALCLDCSLVWLSSLGCSVGLEEQEECCCQPDSEIIPLQDGSVLSTAPLESCLVSVHREQAGGLQLV